MDESREDFADRLNLAGASESTLREWERGTRTPSPLVAESLVPRLAAASGLPEGFFWATADVDESGQLNRIEGDVREVRRALSRLGERLDAWPPKPPGELHRLLEDEPSTGSGQEPGGNPRAADSRQGGAR